MTPERWAAIKSVFNEVCAQPPAEQNSRLDSLCAGDAELRAAVVRLLVAERRADQFLETPAASLWPAALNKVEEPGSRSGDRIGPYRLVREIGRGGMGTVYLADRDDNAYQQRVAVKVAREAQSARALEMFRSERQILASLEHPNIARLLDGGTTGDGVLYFVMEFVEGEPIDAYCDAHQLTIRQRLALFRTVCNAVDHAHRNLIVHRDLKPSNILVSNGVPKLLDFGIAKLLAPDADGAADRDPTRRGMLTPEFASPEQIRGEPIRPAADVFALGVLLFKLLTNKSVYGAPTPSPYDLARAICEIDPQYPSALATTSSARRALAGDIDTIVLKALKKAPQERYVSAAQLGDDIGRHLSGRPIIARDQTAAYRATKFVRRHAIAVSAGVLLLLSLAGGLAATLWQARQTDAERERAERHFNDVRQLASSLIFEINDGIENLPGAMPARQLLIKRAIDYFDRLSAEEADNPALQRELAAAYDKLGDVLGRPYSTNLGESGAALANHRKALAIRERLARTSGDRQAQLDLWASYVNVGNILRETSNSMGALELHSRAREVIAAQMAGAPDDAALLRAAARTAVTMAHSYEQVGRVRESLASAQSALGFDEKLLAREPSSAVQGAVGTDHGRVGIAQMRLQEWPQALESIRKRFAIARELAQAEPANVAFRRGLSTAHLQLGQALARNGDISGAFREQTSALAIREGLAAQDPADRQATIDLMFVKLELARLLTTIDRHEDAVSRLREALAVAEALVVADPTYMFFRLSLAQGLTRLSQALIHAGDRAAALPLAQRARDLAEGLTRADPDDARLRFELAMAYEAMGDARRGADEPDAARTSANEPVSSTEWYRRSLAIMTAMRDEGVLPGGTLFGEESAQLEKVARKLTGGD